MSAISKYDPGVPPEQQAIRAKCFHPSGKFIEFTRDAVEQSIPDTYQAINQPSNCDEARDRPNRQKSPCSREQGLFLFD